MPVFAGWLYFAWVDPGETTFVEAPGPSGHLRWDAEVFAFRASQQEAKFAELSVTIKNPRQPPLAPGRKQHAWFAIECDDSGTLFKFFGRLVALPSNLIGDEITFEFEARPADFQAQWDALTNSLKVLPKYDELFFDESAEEDPDHVLEGYSALPHTPRDGQTVTISDELSGEDGVLEFDEDSALFDGLEVRMEGVQKTTAIVNVEAPWTQLATGSVDLTEWITENWVNDVPDIVVPLGIVTSYSLNDQNWPKNGAGMGSGWKVQESSCSLLYPVDVNSHSESNKTVYKWANGSTTQLDSTVNVSYIGVGRLTSGPVVPLGSAPTRFGSPGAAPPGSVIFPAIVTEDNSQVGYGDDGAGGREVVSFSRSYAHTITVVPLLHLKPTLVVAYEAGRPFTERWRLTMTADVQPVTSAEDDAAIIRLNDLRMRNLSETVGEGTEAYLPIGDTKRRSYINSSRGQDSLRYVLNVTRATLRRASRIGRITFEPLLEHMPAVTLRKSALVTEPRIPGGQALGKIIAYSLALDGDSGQIQCSVTIGVAVGRGGTVTATEGEGLYVDKAALGPDIQEFSGRSLLLDDADDLGYSVPLFAPNDDGLAFESQLTVEQVVEEALTIENPPGVQRVALLASPYQEGHLFPVNPSPEMRQQAVEERSESLRETLTAAETRAVFKLRSLDGEFEPGYEVGLTGLRIPKGIDLETPLETV